MHSSGHHRLPMGASYRFSPSSRYDWLPWVMHNSKRTSENHGFEEVYLDSLNHGLQQCRLGKESVGVGQKLLKIDQLSNIFPTTQCL